MSVEAEFHKTIGLVNHLVDLCPNLARPQMDQLYVLLKICEQLPHVNTGPLKKSLDALERKLQIREASNGNFNA